MLKKPIIFIENLKKFFKIFGKLNKLFYLKNGTEGRGTRTKSKEEYLGYKTHNFVCKVGSISTQSEWKQMASVCVLSVAAIFAFGWHRSRQDSGRF